ncbi:MAG: ABC transporter permease [Acidobacteriia bacterium]|nr:ABC transporter permease [Terriglobia bacterium]
MNTLLQDLRYGIRMLMKSPGFTIIAVLTLALGIGANIAIFTVVNSVLLRHLPVKNSDRMVVIWNNNPQNGWARIGPAGLDYLTWKERSRSFEDLFLFEHGTGTITGHGEPEQVTGLRVTTNFGNFFDIQPVLGRTFRLDESHARHNLAMLSYGYWKRRYGADPGAIGGEMTLNGEPYTIIGVVPASFASLFPMDVIVPFDDDWVRRADGDLGVLGRLKKDSTLNQATADLNVIAKEIEQERPNRKGWGAVIVPVEKVRVEYIRPALLALLGAVTFVLLIACVNVANLMLARSVARQKEVAIRLALGARRLQVARPFLTESALLATAGGSLGLILALWTTELLTRVLPSRIPVVQASDSILLPTIRMDGTVILFTVFLTVLTVLLFGLIPALQSSKANLTETINEGGRGALAGARGHQLQGILVIVEAGLAFALVIGAGLMIQSFWRLMKANPGFASEHRLALRMKLPMDTKDSKYLEPHQRAVALQQFLRSVQSISGVRSAALTEIVPMSQEDQDRGLFKIEGAATSPEVTRYAADFRDVSSGFFQTMGIPVLHGRTFTDHDNLDGSRVVMIDETLAHHYFPDQDPLGRHLEFPGANHPVREIVGVVGGVYDNGFDQQPRPTVYFPYLQSPDQTISMVIRTDMPTRSILPAIKNAIWSVDKDQPIFNVRTMEDIVAGNISAERLAFLLLGVFAFVALTLAAIGLYGVTSYSVSQRTHEIGIRMALGAERRDVLKLILSRVFGLTALGVVAGAVAALVLTRLLSSLLYDVRATDPMTYIFVTVVLLMVALLACYIPARRATQVDPLVALRYE